MLRLLTLFLILFVIQAHASSCVVSNCDCKGSVGPGMDCSLCSGKNCVCDCPATLEPLKMSIFNVTNALIPDSLAATCISSGCNCGTYNDCSTCTGRKCQCSCSAVGSEVQQVPTTNGCLTNAQCKGSSCYSTAGSTTYCCPPGTTSCSVSVVNGVGQCTCY